MKPQDVVSPTSLPPTDLEQFQTAWVLYLEREGIKGDRQPTVDDMADYIAAMGIAAVDEPQDEPQEQPTAEEEKKSKKPKAPTLTPEQEALAKAPWTREDVAAWKQHCAQGMRGDPDIYPERYTAREQTNWLRRRRGIPELPPDPPRPPMIWRSGGRLEWDPKSIRGNSGGGFRRPGSSQHP